MEKICYNCFQALTDAGRACPYCGFDLAENEKKFPVALRAGTVLNNRYLVGRVLGQANPVRKRLKKRLTNRNCRRKIILSIL